MAKDGSVYQDFVRIHLQAIEEDYLACKDKETRDADWNVICNEDEWRPVWYYLKYRVPRELAYKWDDA